MWNNLAGRKKLNKIWLHYIRVIHYEGFLVDKHVKILGKCYGHTFPLFSLILKMKFLSGVNIGLENSYVYNTLVHCIHNSVLVKLY